MRRTGILSKTWILPFAMVFCLLGQAQPLPQARGNSEADNFDIILNQSDEGASLDIRYAAKSEHDIQLILLDGEFRELAELFSGRVQKDEQMLIRYARPLPAGRYLLITGNGRQRYYKSFEVN